MEAAETLKEHVLKVLDDLPPQQLAQVLDFALFVKARHLGESQAGGNSTQSTSTDLWDLLTSLQGTVEAPSDWSLEHDHYLYGTPKHSQTENE